MTTHEEWRKIPGYENYEVSNTGKVRSERGRELKPRRVREYARVALYKNGNCKDFLVSRLVASAFIGPSPEGLVVDHIDANPTNNNVKNLEYVTQQENIRRAMAKGLSQKASQVQLTAFGKTQHINAWARELGLKTDTLHKRLSRGWGIEKSIATPARKRNCHYV